MNHFRFFLFLKKRLNDYVLDVHFFTQIGLKNWSIYLKFEVLQNISNDGKFSQKLPFWIC